MEYYNKNLVISPSGINSIIENMFQFEIEDGISILKFNDNNVIEIDQDGIEIGRITIVPLNSIISRITIWRNCNHPGSELIKILQNYLDTFTSESTSITIYEGSKEETIKEIDKHKRPKEVRFKIVQEFRLGVKKGDVITKDGWAAKRGISGKTLYRWEKEFPE